MQTIPTKCLVSPSWVELGFHDRNFGGHQDIQGHRVPHPKLRRLHLVYPSVSKIPRQTWGDPEQASEYHNRLPLKGRCVSHLTAKITSLDNVTHTLQGNIKMMSLFQSQNDVVCISPFDVVVWSFFDTISKLWSQFNLILT